MLDLTTKTLNFDLPRFSYIFLDFLLKGGVGVCGWVVSKQKISLLKYLHVNTENVDSQNNCGRKI